MLRLTVGWWPSAVPGPATITAAICISAKVASAPPLQTSTGLRCNRRHAKRHRSPLPVHVERTERLGESAAQGQSFKSRWRMSPPFRLPFLRFRIETRGARPGRAHQARNLCRSVGFIIFPVGVIGRRLRIRSTLEPCIRPDRSGSAVATRPRWRLRPRRVTIKAVTFSPQRASGVPITAT